MRIALCLHGLFDSVQDTSSTGLDGFDYIRRSILSKGDVDVFVHSWSVGKRDVILDLYNPKAFEFEEQVDFTPVVRERGLDKLRGVPREPQFIFSHFYSISRVFNLLNLDDYDVIVKSRFDLGRINRASSGPHNGNNPFPVQCINFNPNVEPGRIYMANWNHFDMGPADMWFYGDASVMRNFKSLYEDACNNMVLRGDYYEFSRVIESNEGNVSNVIAFYKWWMLRNGLWDRRVLLESVWE